MAMTTDHVGPGRRAVSERTVDFFIQRGSDSWGDEAERTRYYEVHSAILQLVVLIQPCVAAGLIVAIGRPALVPCLALWAVPIATMLLGTRYLERKGVRAYQLAERSRTRSLLLWALPNSLPLAAYGWVQRGEPSTVPMLIGAVIGAGVGIAALKARAARERRSS